MNWKILVTAVLAAKRGKDSITFTRPRMPDRASYGDFLTVNESFIFELDCSKMDNASCEYARKEVNKVSEWIATDILLRVPIKVAVAFEPIYRGKLYDMETKAPIAARKAEDESGQILLYEASLMNQIDLTDKFPFDAFRRIQSLKPSNEIETDIKLRFINSSLVWNFTTTASNSTATRNAPDFKLLFAHLMTRAFGIRSSLGWSGYNWQSRSVVVVDTNPVPSLYGWYFMNCITAFDSLMHVVPTKILQDCKKFLSGGKCKYKYDSIAAITKQLEPVQMKPFRLPLRDKATLDVILQLKSKIELPIVAKFSDNSTLPLSSNFGYLESKLFDSKEFLMTKESVESGEHLTSLMARHGMNHSIYGPETLKVLEEIGWPTRRRPQNIQFVLSKLQPPVVSQQFPENP